MNKVLLFALLCITLGLSQTPNSFNYQTAIRNASGDILSNQSISLAISILQTTSNGSIVYRETHSITTNDYGVANLQIGTGTITDGNIDNIDWGNDIYFMGVAIDTSGGTSYTPVGTSQIVSVPYAINAKQVEEVDNLNNVLNESNDAGAQNITNLADPINDQDAVTKAYVDLLEARITALENTGSSTTIPDIYQKFYNLSDIYVDGDNIVIRTSNLPDHGSPFYPVSDPLYEAYNGTNTNFNTVINWQMGTLDPDLVAQDITLTIPLNPVEDTNHQATTTYAIGIALNGIVFFNQYNGGGQLLNNTEFDNLDQYNGHPTPTNYQYHYHLEPLWITTNNGSDSVIGVLRDGFFVYGPMEDGVEITTADLDDYHGHFGVTEDFPSGVYHYHVTGDAPWLNGDGYYGTPGTLTD